MLALRDGSYSTGRTGPTPRIKLVVGQPPMRPNLDRLAAAYHATAWVLGREAAALLPLEGLADTSIRPSWSWQAAALADALEQVAPAMARDGRVVQLTEPGPESIVATALGGSSAKYRLLDVRLAEDSDRDGPGIVELLPPGGVLPPGPRTRGNVPLDPVPGGAGDPNMVPGRGIFGAPERVEDRPFSAVDTARIVTSTAVETLRARGEPASFARLLGAILVGLDRAGQLRRLVDASPPRETGIHADDDRRDATDRSPGTPAPVPLSSSGHEAAPDVVEQLLSLIREELGRPTQRRLTEIEPDRWWLADPQDVATAAVPLADRVEWSVFSLLSTAGPLTETAFLERIASLFTGHDLPEERLVRACLESYRSPDSTPDLLVTNDDLVRRSQEHTELLALIAEAGHRLGMRIWIGRREQSRRYGSGTLGDLLGRSEDHLYLGRTGRAAEELAEVDAIWYLRGKVVLLFEVEWTAMIGEPLLGRHVYIPPDDNLIRFLVIPPERTELVRYKLARSPLLRAAMNRGTWHIIKSDHLRTFLARDPLALDDLEPYLGLDPAIERGSEQMALFGG